MFMAGDPGQIREVPYWLTVNGENVTAIEEQYLP